MFFVCPGDGFLPEHIWSLLIRKWQTGIAFHIGLLGVDHLDGPLAVRRARADVTAELRQPSPENGLLEDQMFLHMFLYKKNTSQGKKT